MTLPRLISRLLINSKHLDRNVACKLRKTKLSVELESYNSGYQVIHNYFSTSARLPAVLSEKSYVNIFDPIRLNETQNIKALNIQVIYINSSITGIRLSGPDPKPTKQEISFFIF